jgi:DNA adenine methylase
LPFSILKYAGGKPWVLEHVLRFLHDRKAETIVEPFAGSALVSLTLLNRGYAKHAFLAEKDLEVRDFLERTRTDEGLATRAEEWTACALRLPRDKQRDFVIDSILRLKEKDPALSLLLRSRSSFNGILTGNWPAVTRRPLESWWPLTISSSLRMLYAMRDRFEVVPDAFDALAQTSSSSNYAFVDPPYSFGDESPGRLLYREWDLDHEQLMKALFKWKGRWQLTYEYSSEMITLLKNAGMDNHGVSLEVVSMRTGHGIRKMELVVSRESRRTRRI